MYDSLKSKIYNTSFFKYQKGITIIINLLKVCLLQMISTESNLFKLYLNQSDNKSQASTEGQENYDFHSSENFLFSYGHCNDHKSTKSKIKSSLCKNFTEKGFCPYGQKCQFAHGTHELRINLDVNNSYKTKPCNAFFKKGHCQYGYRCNFVHREASLPDVESKWKNIYSLNREFFQNLGQGSESKLLKILE